ncbi:hypothetical protein F5884DRAFT_746065 [Xylogone sp. PMI_703]|nr:hypothetical protein F5884DRAFT_746065 [Xylogone sp. PMI_703]
MIFGRRRSANMGNPATARQDSLSLLNVGDDIVIMILDELQQTSPHSVVSLGLVHSSFRKLAQQCHYREVEFDHSSAACKRLKLINDKQLLSAVRSLRVTDNVAKDQSHSWPLLADLVPRMSGLKDITITSNDVPAVMLDAIQKCRDVRLYVVVSPPDNVECLTLKRLKGVVNLYSLDINATYTDPRHCLRVTESLKDILLSCLNLRILKLDIHQPRSGCVVYGPGPTYLGCGFKDGERPPPLEVLELIEYPFGRPAAKEVALRFCYWDGYQGTQYEEDYWAGTFDWSRLRRLRTTSVRLAMKFQQHLTALKEVDILASEDNTEIRAFYAQIPSRLERIRAPTLETIGIDSVLRHGNQLRSLQLHRKEDWNGMWRAKTVDAESLRAIRDQCQYLEELHIDLARDGDWPYEVFDIIASFPRLKTLSLWFELGRNSDSSPVQPYVTFSSCDMIFRHLWDHSVSRPPHLQELRVFSGSPRDVGFGFVTPEAFWSRYNSSAFLCSLSERDDEASEGIHVTTCPHLSAIENEALQLALKRGKNPEDYIPRQSDRRTDRVVSKIGSLLSGERFGISRNGVVQVSREGMQVAWKGPTPQNSWVPHY